MPRHNGRDARTSPAAFLGAKLRQGRISAGYASQDALAAKLGFDRTVITKAETGERPPTDEVLSVWCEVCGLDLDMYTGLAELARSADGPVPTWFETWLEAERAAHMLRYWSPLIVTTLFQTADYRCAVVMAGGIDAERAEELTAATMERQNVLGHRACQR